MSETVLSREQIMEVIPHRDPMLLVDSVLSMTPGVSIEGVFFVDPRREIFTGHFPGEPVLPGVYTVEIMAQVSDILLLSMDRYAGKVPLFIGIDNVRFLRKIQPGDILRIRSRIQSERSEKAIVTCCAEVYVKEELACTGEVTLAMR
jgi:3-hydroxyacyl-[acyl-carrier-protein] dehydratase